ncbi:cadherin-23-like isoform X3 [Biomphalaria glabrata]|uniref:Cadherin-23-like isoform X3 n=1 Tax=Biomphalaria glabrata TaxID=6526 RepID=A0A9W2ZM65_BIOGL|nr:cadherin-23-like isoform X3 [Biomphalaria glabrata]
MAAHLIGKGVSFSPTSHLTLVKFWFTLLVLGFALISQKLAQGASNSPPQPGSYSNTIISPEDTPIGTTIGNITASDPDGQDLYFNTDTDDTRELVTLSNPRKLNNATNTWIVDIKLKSVLDRDYAPNERRLYFLVTDGSSSIPIWITLFITDVNDVAPQFVNLPYEATVREDASPGTVIFSGVFAKDPDNGRNILYTMAPNAQVNDQDYATTFEINQYNGNITLRRQLDYETHSYYQYKIMAEDEGGLTAEPVGFVVYVYDVQDTPPAFVNLPYSVQIDEDMAVGKSVLTVLAIDGDKGIPNNITYSFVSGDYQNFNLDPTTGIITVNKTLDRDTELMRNTGGVYAMIVKASEVVPPGQINKGSTTATTLVTITVRDVNDNSPIFSQSTYNATILENMPIGVPVTFLDGVLMRVLDIDQGENSHFILTIEVNSRAYYDFSPLPKEIYSESSVLLRVNNSEVLDYEKNHSLIFQVVAREVNTAEKRSSTTTVTVNIEDMNDNAPAFSQSSYILSVYENTPIDTSIQTFNATDLDSGIYKVIQYSLRGGNGRFKIEPNSGLFKVAGNLDREEMSQYFLTIEAKDGGGLRTPAEITVNILDRNDKRPIFIRDDYYGTIREGSSQFLRPLKVEAVDDDEPNTNNSLVSYRIISTPARLTNNFTIDSKTGIITVTSPIDYEKLDKILGGVVTLIVEAYDSGDPVLSSQIEVNITVEDVNDFAPVFSKSEYFTTIAENAQEGLAVITVVATDFDGTSPNNDFIYRIETGALDKFRINFQTGVVEVESGAVLDRETKKEYILNISAIDRGTPPLIGLCILKINLTDVNDEVPVFPFPSKSVEINENTQISSPVFLYSASDPDLNSSLVYSIGEVVAFSKNSLEDRINVTSTGVKYYFGMNSKTGQIFVNNTLDRETAVGVILQILVEDVYSQIGKQVATATLSVTLLDYNDNPPKFVPSPIYNVRINEMENVMALVVQLSATDADDGQTVTFSLGAATIDAFAVSSDGTVQLKAKLDREKSDKEIFEVIARDNGYPQLTSTATVTVTVLDANDNSPVFEPYNMTYGVLENESVGFLVTRFAATDKDIGDAGTVFYTLDGEDNDGSFSIAMNTGELTVAKSLDRETKPFYKLEIVASDSKANPDDRKSNRTNTITFIILDVDDNPPVFTSVSPAKPSIPETADMSVSVVTLVADDADDKTTDNGRVIYSLTSDSNATLSSGTSFFKINNNTGVISPAMSIHGYAGFYYVTVMATNKAQKFNATKKVVIEIVDVNDNVPQFTRPSTSTAMAYVQENAEIGTSVFKLEAFDADKGKNGEIHFAISLVNNQYDGSKAFAVNELSGLITTKDEMNAETQSRYELKLEARDQGVPVPFTATVTMTIIVIDKNDHKPEFVNLPAPFPIAIVENQQSCTNVSLAIDRDLNSTYTVICYYLIGSSLLETFILDTFSGMLCLNQTLDRESNPFINIVIQALDDCFKTVTTDKIYPFEKGQLYPSMFRPTNTDKLWIEVQVQDVNDNPPQFKSKELTLGITRVTQFGKFIMELKDVVEDRDSERWGVDFFNSTSNFVAHPDNLNQELLNLGIIEPFKLFSNGSIKTNMYFKTQMSGFFTVGLKVSDKGGLTDTATLRISLINDDQRLKIIFRRSINSVGEFKEKIVSDLSSKVGVRIVMDSIQTHETETGQADTAQTDMFIHGEDYQTNEVIPASKLLSLIDSKNALLIGILNDYNVLQIVPAIQEQVDSSIEDKLKMAVILIAVVLGSVCITLSVVLYYVYRRYHRKLKAATAMAYVPSDSDLYKADIPGTQINSFENANPIFLEKIMLENHVDGLSDLEDVAVVSQSSFEEGHSLSNRETLAGSSNSVQANNSSQANRKTGSRSRNHVLDIGDIDNLSLRDSGIEERSGPSEKSGYTIYNQIYAEPKTKPNKTSTLKNGSATGSLVKPTSQRPTALSKSNMSKKPKAAPSSKPRASSETYKGVVNRNTGMDQELPYASSASSDETPTEYLDFRNGLYGSNVAITDL